MSVSARKYFLSCQGKPLGPFSPQQIRTKLFRKAIFPDDYVWREGLGDEWVLLKMILDELPADAVPPPVPPPDRLKNIEITHPDGSPSRFVEVPEKGVYEPPATLKQKNLLMKLGCSNPETIRHIGRDQASFIIDSIKSDYEDIFERHQREERQARTRRQAVGSLVTVLILVAGIAIYWLANRDHLDNQNAAPTFAPGNATLANASSRHATVASETIVLRKPTIVRLRYGSATLPAGLRLEVIARDANGIRVRYAGESVAIPPE